MNNEMYKSTVSSLLRENARLRGLYEASQKKIDDLLAERTRLKASRGAVLKSLDIKGRLKSIIERTRRT